MMRAWARVTTIALRAKNLAVAGPVVFHELEDIGNKSEVGLNSSTYRAVAIASG